MAAAPEEATTYDLVSIGAGSGGTRCSRMAGKAGLKVAVIELPFGLVSSDKVGGAGGTCVIRGCVPKKMLVYASAFEAEFADAGGFGWNGQRPAGYDLKSMMAKKAAEVARLNGIYGRLMTNSGCDMFEGRGSIVDAHTVDVELPDGSHKTLKTKNILIATGGRAFVPDLPGKELCVTSDEALVFDDVPETLCIIGGGYIAVEFAGIYAGLGTKVHLVYRRELPLRGFDEECRQVVADNLAKRGVILHTNCSPTAIAKHASGKGLTVSLESSSTEFAGPMELEADQVMFATGRKPNVRNLGLEAVGVAQGPNGAIKVNDVLQTSVPNIYALGDVIDRIQLTPVALMEGMALVETLKGSPKVPDYGNVASAVFCQPPLATCGLTEAQAIASTEGEVDVYVETFRPLRNTISGREERSIMKLVVDHATDRVLGAHMVGPDSAEIMQGIAIAVKCGATKAQFDSTVGIHPTSAEEFVTMRTLKRRVPGQATAVSKI